VVAEEQLEVEEGGGTVVGEGATLEDIP